MEDNKMQIRKVTYSDAEALLKLHDSVWPDVDYDKKDKMNQFMIYAIITLEMVSFEFSFS